MKYRDWREPSVTLCCSTLQSLQIRAQGSAVSGHPRIPQTLGRRGAVQRDYGGTVISRGGVENQFKCERGDKTQMKSFQDSLASSKTPKRAWSCLLSKLEHKNIVPTSKTSIPALQGWLTGCKKGIKIQVLRTNTFRSCFADFKHLQANSRWFSHAWSCLACKRTCLIKYCICLASSAIKRPLWIFILVLHSDRECETNF